MAGDPGESAREPFSDALGGEVTRSFRVSGPSVMFSDAIGVMLLAHDYYRRLKRPIGGARRESQALGTRLAHASRRSGGPRDREGAGAFL